MTTVQQERTHHCNELTENNVGEEVILMGWVKKRRVQAKIIFVDLYDRRGITQVTLTPDFVEQSGLDNSAIRTGSCLGVKGKVVLRESANDKLLTGKIEVVAEDVTVFNVSEPLPFPMADEVDASDLTKLKYRYLDIRRGPMLKNLVLRAKVVQEIRNILSRQDFIDVETPVLIKSTPEGARDYLVPSRVDAGKFYALPQSPQLYKQILMCSGLDRYYQIAKCFRDEDLRADRQPEFTQVDLELSFPTRETIYNIVENMFKEVFSNVLNEELDFDFPRMSYKDVLEKYGEDKPDLRYGLELVNLNEVFKESTFKAFKGAVDSGGLVKGLKLEGKAGDCSNSFLKKLEKGVVKPAGAKGLAWAKVQEDGINSPIAKFLAESEQKALVEAFSAEPNDLILLIADTSNDVVNGGLSALRRHLASEFDLIDNSKWAFLWIEDFPLFELDGEGNLQLLHHPFTRPHPEDVDKLETNPVDVRALSYDLVLNGFELGSGSLRIHETELQKRLLSAIGMSDEEAQNRFGFLLEALTYGAPPHGGMGLGLDRIIMLMVGETSLRETIAFPKTQTAACPMTSAPDFVDEEQLKELKISIEN